MAQRISIGLAACGMLLCLWGTAMAARAITSNAGHLSGLFLWTLLPLGLAALICVQVVRAGRLWTVWVPVGALWGFVVAALWSLGTFYAAGGFVFLLSAIARLAALHAWKKALLVWLWFIAGMTSLGPIFLAMDWIRSRTPGVTVSHAEAIVFGSWVFLGTLSVLALWELVRRLLIGRVCGPASFSE